MPAAIRPSVNGVTMNVRRVGVVRRDHKLRRAWRGNARTAFITRASNDSLTGTGARSSRAMSFILGSYSSRTMHLTQQLTETITGAHDSHLERRHSDSRELRHLVVTQVF